MATLDEFWGRAGPGLLDLGVGLYNKRAGQKEAQQRLQAAQGPLFQQAQAGAGGMLAQAGGFNPDELAASRFTAGEEMLAPVQAKQQADLIRMLRAKGMLGISNYSPGIEGFTPDGTAVQPHLAALYAAQAADRTKRAQASLGEGQAYADRLVGRAGDLQSIAGRQQQTGLQGQRTQPSRAASNAGLLKGAVDIFRQNPNILSDIGGLFKGGLDWLGGGGGYGFGGFANPNEFSIW